MINFVKLMKLNSFFLITLVPLLLIPTYAQESNTIRLNPTDDTFILANYFDPDNVKNMQEKPLGNIDKFPSLLFHIAIKNILADIYKECLEVPIHCSSSLLRFHSRIE